ncbi:tRNA lysidine(34) synthetase TilS [Streptantibioticus silvisoli]|uniref:tRNA(Ile)-lysidine synthase n=1 Tax=Streptantibioticus silvisoli TaxID=2705255 RepID=A0ABT6VWR8_9ACTN|nr:tRNA lysidine(34) synthetase TilS [Streptantibioticus silvisoli]MDI5962889.1 tRNA lysidine(34) synthetase TilS [Streptantibioticus silvisoli]
MGPHPAVAAIRLAVRRVLHDVVRDVLAEQDARHTGVLFGEDAGVPHADAPHAGVPRGAGPRSGARSAARSLSGVTYAGPPGAAPLAPAPVAEQPDPPGPARSAVIAMRRRTADRPAPGPERPLVLAACSGGADSMALAAALAFEAARAGVRAGAVTVDHGLQSGSAARALDVADRLRDLGLDPVEAVGVTVGRQGGPEAAARDARYAALESAATTLGAAAVLLGHTRDDQAETVLLGLARGSGTRSLSGMAAVSGPGGRYRRPLLLLDRDTTRKACLVQGIDVWEDPHNADPAYTRARVRHEALPVLEKSLGRGVVASLARTAQLFRDDADALDQWAASAGRDAAVDGDPDGALAVARLRPLPPAVRRRVIRSAAVSAGCPGGSLFARHVEETDRLLTDWRGQGPLNLPGGVVALRTDGKLVFRRATAE